MVLTSVVNVSCMNLSHLKRLVGFNENGNDRQSQICHKSLQHFLPVRPTKDYVHELSTTPNCVVLLFRLSLAAFSSLLVQGSPNPGNYRTQDHSNLWRHICLARIATPNGCTRATRQMQHVPTLRHRNSTFHVFYE